MRNRLIMDKIQKRIVGAVAAEEELKDVVPFKYDEGALTRQSKIILTVDSGLKNRGDRL